MPLYITVIPSRLEISKVEDVLGGMLGELSVRRWMYEDPILVKGFQEYTGREPMNSISWTQSAKRGNLIVNQYDHTAEPHVLIMVYVHDEAGVMFERIFSCVRTVAEELESRHVSWSFISNANIFTVQGENYFPEGLGINHVSMLNESLGRATYGKCHSFTDMQKTISRVDSVQGILVLGTDNGGLSVEQRKSLEIICQGAVKYMAVSEGNI